LSAQLIKEDRSSEAGAAAAPETSIPQSALDRRLLRYCGEDLYVRPCRHARGVIAAAVLLVLCIVSIFFFDGPVATWVHSGGAQAFVRRHRIAGDVARWPGHFLFAGVLAVVLWLWHRWRLQGAAILMWACLLSGSNWFLKWVAGRHRPDEHSGLASFDFAPFRGGWAGLFHQKNLSMPSGDASLAFAVAATLAWLMPRWGWAFFAGAALVACERLAENAHHLSDVLAGAALGVVSFHLGHLAGSLLGAKTARGLGIEPPNLQ
jgi:membrane-associated phospholipid phosphatase